jgi:hypothetical protein
MGEILRDSKGRVVSLVVSEIGMVYGSIFGVDEMNTS